MDFKEEWLLPGAVVTVDAETTQALVGQIHRLIRLVGSIKLEQSLQPPADEPVAWMMTNAVGKPYFRKKPQDKVFNPQPVYTAPLACEWVGLTVEYMQREIEAEREACAEVCDEIVARYRHADDAPEMVAANWCADGVRARGNT